MEIIVIDKEGLLSTLRRGKKGFSARTALEILADRIRAKKEKKKVA